MKAQLLILDDWGPDRLGEYPGMSGRMLSEWVGGSSGIRTLALEKDWPLDESRVDYRTALDMLSEGWGTTDAAGALRDRSPRHRSAPS